MKWFVLSILLCFFVNTASYAKCSDKPVVVAVIDTGFGYGGAGVKARLCRFGHKDFTQYNKSYLIPGIVDPVPLDIHGHGTNLVGIIETYAKLTHTNFCIVVIKYYEGSGWGNHNLLNLIKSLNYATDIHVDYINYSGGGRDPSDAERAAVLRFLNQGGHMTAAAGNDSENLDLPQNGYYPAKYDPRIVVVGSLDKYGKHLPSSNFGSIVTRWELGLDVTDMGLPCLVPVRRPQSPLENRCLKVPTNVSGNNVITRYQSAEKEKVR